MPRLLFWLTRASLPGAVDVRAKQNVWRRAS